MLNKTGTNYWYMQQHTYLKSTVKGKPDTKDYIWFHLFEILEKAKPGDGLQRVTREIFRWYGSNYMTICLTKFTEL